jgi:DNA end-binding protein Ku
MAARPTWKGYLKISLVNIPVRVFPATDTASTISFNQLHAECQSRIQQKRWCPRCEREVTLSEVVKGYEFEKGRYVVMTEDDLGKVRPSSTRVIDLVQFADASQLDPIYFERPYYLAPDNDVAGEAFAVMRDGMAGKVGIGKLALYGREYLVAVQPRERGLVMYTLRQAAEVRSMTQIDELGRLPEKIKAQEANLARQVIETFERPLELGTYRDDYQSELRRIIDAKVAGQEVSATPEEAPSNVVDLMEALRRSLDSVSATRKSPAKASLPRTRAAGRRAEQAGSESDAVVKATPAKRRKAS